MSNKKQHTPGPWGLREDNHGCKNVYRLGQDEDGGIFALEEIGYTHGRADESEDAANARLIAAAPAMRQRLEYAQRLLLQGDTEGALREIGLGLLGDYEE